MENVENKFRYEIILIDRSTIFTGSISAINYRHASILACQKLYETHNVAKEQILAIKLLKINI